MKKRASFFSWAGRDGSAEAEPELYIPAARMAQVQGVMRRRVSDAVEDAFGRACLAGDVATARDLIMVMERMGRRGRSLRLGERRLLPERLHRLRTELERCERLQVGASAEVVGPGPI